MSIATHDSGQRLLLYDVPWTSYTALLDALGDRRLRHSYDRGTLEMMSPLKEHDWSKRLIARFIETLTLERRIPIQSIGSTTLRRDDLEKGLEPDECYYIGNEPAVRFRETYDPDRDPPPDLAVEVDVTNSSVGRLGIYAALGVPEVWRLAGSSLVMLVRNAGGQYDQVERSQALPLLTPQVILEFLNRRHQVDETSLIGEFVDWARGQQE